MKTAPEAALAPTPVPEAAIAAATAPALATASATDASATLTVLFDGACPLCRREIAHFKGLADRCIDSVLCFVDISAEGEGGSTYAVDRAKLLARFHVQRADGSRLDGPAAFVAMWSRLPGWGWLGRLAQFPGVLGLLEVAYRGFLMVRPMLQALARRLETLQVAARPHVAASMRDAATATVAARATVAHANSTAVTSLARTSLSRHLVRELRSDHAGETGAVQIYRGIQWVARRRQDAELLAFAHRHGEAEAEHLLLVEGWLSPVQRSRLLLPWRVAGWMTGALPAMTGQRAVYATIAAVETFVDQHYQQQIDHLQAHGGPEGLLPLLLRCQADEQHHRDEAAALAPPTHGSRKSWVLKLWCALVGSGSAAAVMLARRI
jgi:demethoxyubiquinone hydroxylase (CLK1/Coq7/Cat5 family)